VHKNAFGGRVPLRHNACRILYTWVEKVMPKEKQEKQEREKYG